jgi:hypothetical protein
MLLLVPAADAQLPQARADSVREETVRLRGFVRAAETQASKILAIFDREEPVAPPVVMDWRTGVWEVYAAGFRGTMDLTARTATWENVTAPIAPTFIGDLLEVRLGVEGVAPSGLMTLRHAEGRMIGTITYQGQERQATASRPNLIVVTRLAQGECTFAQFTDGSWGVAPFTGPCHDALNTHVGGMKFVARTIPPEE